MLLIFVLLNFTFLQKKSIIMADVPILISVQTPLCGAFKYTFVEGEY